MRARKLETALLSCYASFCLVFGTIIYCASSFRELDRLYGYPPAAVVEKFQQRLKTIKAIDRYSVFIQAIQFSDTIQSPDDMIDLIKRSIAVSDRQGYTNILSVYRQRYGYSIYDKK